VRIGGVNATNVQVVDSGTVTAVTPANTAGVKDVVVVRSGSEITGAGLFTYGAAVPAWATLIEAAPDPAVVTSSTLRAAITATGYAWRVKDTATQIEMLLIPPGTFQMGCSASQQNGCGSWENPVHTVTLTSAFYMGRYEVTQAQWQARMGSNPSYFQSASSQVPAAQVPNRPVERVSWNTIQGFLVQTGMRLPTEAEWEYAYRAGTTTAFHGYTGNLSGTNDENLAVNIGWWNMNWTNTQTRPVGGKLANGYGLHDMAGNVWEWVNDWSGAYPSSPQNNPTGPASGSTRVLRGGSWYSYPWWLRSSVRNIDGGPPDHADYNVGFRVARAP
jgi:formylglycine-generating enzyme required for sulfatase activity